MILIREQFACVLTLTAWDFSYQISGLNVFVNWLDVQLLRDCDFIVSEVR